MPTNNQQLAARRYELQFKQMLQAVFAKQAYFADFFGGGIEALDGVQNNDIAFYVKTSDIPVVVGTAYNKGANVAFGTGTSNSTRFGNMTEVKYSNTPVNYDWEWVFNEGLDRWTVNNDLQAALADRLELQAQAKTQTFNGKHSLFISTVAGKEAELADYTAGSVLALFNELSAHYTNIQSIGNRVASVTPELYNAIVDHPLTTSAKNSSTSIDNNSVLRFKGFEIREIPETLLQEGDVAYTYIPGVGKAFTGITTARTMETVDFDGIVLQGAGKAGEFILDDNKPAVVKVTLATP